MTSIVRELEAWVVGNRQKLQRNGITLEERIPKAGSNLPWKATIGLEYAEFLVSYTVWERTIYQTTLLVLNTLTLETIVNVDTNSEESSVVTKHLDQVIEHLVSGVYRNAELPT